MPRTHPEDPIGRPPPVYPKPRSMSPSQPSCALPNTGCELLLSYRTSANKKGIKHSCARVSNSPTCLLGQPVPLLLAGSTGWPQTLPSIPNSLPSREEMGRGEGESLGLKGRGWEGCFNPCSCTKQAPRCICSCGWLWSSRLQRDAR